MKKRNKDGIYGTPEAPIWVVDNYVINGEWTADYYDENNVQCKYSKSGPIPYLCPAVGRGNYNDVIYESLKRYQTLNGSDYEI